MPAENVDLTGFAAETVTTDVRRRPAVQPLDGFASEEQIPPGPAFPVRLVIDGIGSPRRKAVAGIAIFLVFVLGFAGAFAWSMGSLRALLRSVTEPLAAMTSVERNDPRVSSVGGARTVARIERRAPSAALASTPVSADVPSSPATMPPIVPEESAVRDKLTQFRDAYDHLDAAAAKAVWPAVDEQALTKAFADLESQHLIFENCRVHPGTSTALAFCRGSATYAGRFGGTPQLRDLDLTFSLEKGGDGWQIKTVDIR